MDLFKLLGFIAIDNTEANQSIDETTERARRSETKTSEAFEKIGGAAKKVATGMAVAGAAIGVAFIGAVEGTREYRTEMGKLDTAFQTNGHSSEAAKKTYQDLQAVLGETDVSVEAANHLAVMTDNEKDLQTWTNICTGVFATFGDSLPIEGLTEAANETAKVGQVTGPLADALTWAGISEDEFNEKLSKCTNEQERQKLIMDTLNDTYKGASDQYKETNKDVIEANRANERLSGAMAKLGEIGEPIMTTIKNAIASMAEKAVPVLEDMGQKIQDMIQWFQQNGDKVQFWAGIIGIAAATVAGFVLVLSWSGIMAKAAAALEIVTVAIKALNVAMRANIIGLIVTAILGLVAAFIYLWNNCDSFRNFWLDLWEVIKNACMVAWEWIKTTWNNVGEWFKEKFEAVKQAGKDAMDSVKDFFSDAWAAIKAVWDFVKPYFEFVWNHIKLVFSVAKSVLTGNFSGAWEGIKGIWNNAKSFFLTVWKGISGIFSNVGSWFSEKFRNAWSNIKNAFSGWGSFFGGLWDNIKSKFGSIGTSIGTAMGNAVKTGMNGVIGIVEKAINKGIGLINSAITLANKIPGVDVGKVSTISLPRLAKGGVLSKGQVGILEGSGAEAIVPLERNKQWISKVAQDMATEQKTNHPVNDRVQEQLNMVIELLTNLLNMNVYLDSGTLVGELAPAIDVRLGKTYTNMSRGNTR